MIREFIKLIENNLEHIHVWYVTDKHDAQTILDDGIDPSILNGDFGYGFYVVKSLHDAKQMLDDDKTIILEYKLKDDMRILGFDDVNDMMLWHESDAINYLDNPKLYRHMLRYGIDGIENENEICIYNPNALKFIKVYEGVVDDPLEEIDTDQLDEVAAGGLARCTAVTVNALLKDFHLRPITLSEVPVDSPGVLNILSTRGLAYKPFPYEAGKTVQQFVATHKLYDWYILTPGHAMALIRGELYDAENKGPDGRKLEAAFQIMRR